ncbi:MAG: hypothetical protein V5A64_04975 [Candidatus Thermoplasmatota archaeon]
MRYGKLAGMAVFVAGILILFLYGIYEGFQGLSLERMDVVVAFGASAIIVGLVLLFISIFIEQQRGKKQLQTEIDEEDLEP